MDDPLFSLRPHPLPPHLAPSTYTSRSATPSVVPATADLVPTSNTLTPTSTLPASPRPPPTASASLLRCPVPSSTSASPPPLLPWKSPAAENGNLTEASAATAVTKRSPSLKPEAKGSPAVGEKSRGPCPSGARSVCDSSTRAALSGVNAAVINEGVGEYLCSVAGQHKQRSTASHV